MGKSLREDVFRYVRRKYHSEIEVLWASYPNYAVFRHKDNQKWYGLVMDLPRCKLGLEGEEIVDVLNLKLDSPLLVDLLTQEEGIFPGYHISRGNWVSVLLDGTVPLDEIKSLVDKSYETTASAQKKKALRALKEWLIPANPAYFDIVHAFDERQELTWKQGAGIKKGDTVFLYVGAPVSAILYRCRVTETELPGREAGRSRMRIRLTKRYDPARFPFAKLKEHYRIFAVRGPRGVPEELSRDLKRS